MSHLTESLVEDAALEWLAGIGYAVLYGPDISPDGSMPERGSYDQVLLTVRLREALARLNPHLSAEMLEEVLRKVQQSETPSLIEENRRLHRYLIEGVPVEVAREDGSIGGDVARLIDLADMDANDWLAVNQYTVIEGQKNRRPDVVLFVNGLPLAVIELKNPGDENATLDGAFNQLQTYKDQIPSLFRTNAVLVTSDGLHARLGSLTANLERFMPWRTVDGSAVAAKGAPELGTVIEGVFEKARFLTLIRDFTVFADTGSGLVKIVAGYHQFHAVRHAVTSTIAAASPKGDRRIGVIWHTQGSGKSLLMAFYAGQIIAHPAMENPTFVVITDRNDLDDQLFGTFSMCRDLLRQTPRQADSREDLQKALTRPAGGVVFTTIQKFAPERGETDYPVLTDRRNVVVIADEAHRSQYGFRARVNRTDRRDRAWLCQVPPRRLAERILHRLHRHPDRAGGREHACRVRRVHRRVRHQPGRRGRRDGSDLLREPPCAHRAGRGREAEARRRGCRANRGRCPERAGEAQAQMGEGRGRRRGRETPCHGRHGPRGALREPRHRHGRQGHDRLHEPPDMRRALRSDRQAASGMA